MLQYIIWDVTPEIFNGFYIRWYGLLFALGYIVAFIIISKILKQEKTSPRILDLMVSYALIGGILGARLGHCLFYEPHIYLRNPLEIIYIWKGGLASHGGAIGVLIGFYLLSRKYKISFIWILSRAMLVVPVTGAFIRMGNLMNSEIYGYATDVPWAFLFKNSIDVQLGTEELVPRHPTQIYEALAYIVTSVILLFYYRKNIKSKNVNNYTIIGIFMIGIFLSRFSIEFLKLDQVQFEQNIPLNMGQWLSIPFILFGIYSLFRKGDYYNAPLFIDKKNKTISEENSDKN